APAAKVADRRNAGRKRAVHASLYTARHSGKEPRGLDEMFRPESGADSALFRLRDYPLPLDGRGHHLQARLGVYGGDGGRAGGFLRVDRIDWSGVSYTV